MKFRFNKRLFWFLKDDAELNLKDPSALDTYVQQVLTHGKTDDVRQLLRTLNPSNFQESFNRLKGFLPNEVKKFWEDFIGSTQSPAKRNP